MMGWNVCDLLSTLAARGRHPAVIAFGNPGTLTWDSETLVHHALRLARSLRQFDRDSRIGLWAPNSPHWIASALGVMAAGHVLVPLDDLADAVQFEAALASAELRLLLTTAEHAETSADILRRLGIRVMLVGVPEVAGRFLPGQRPGRDQ